MHKPFYASGFLFHAPSQQILLQQLTSDQNLMLFGAKSHNGTNPQTVFQTCIESALGVKVPDASIYPVYDYILENLGEQFVFYAQIPDMTPLSLINKTKWFLLSKLSKFKMSEQTRHDIIIGERVIRQRMEPPRIPQYPHL